MKPVNAPKAPAAIGPYSHAIEHNGLIFCSGQIPLNPKTMEIVGSDIEAQTEQVMRNINAVLIQAGSSMEKILKTTIFLASMDDFIGVNAIYDAALKGHKPARSTIEVGALPKGALVEIECIAIKG